MPSQASETSIAWTESMIAIGIAAFLLLLMSCPPLADSAEKSHQTPNIILLVMDNFGYGEVGVYGGGMLRGAATPNIDSIADYGLQLTNFNVEAECTPSWSALMTGPYGVRTRQRPNAAPRDIWYGITKWEITLAEMLSAAGTRPGSLVNGTLGIPLDATLRIKVLTSSMVSPIYRTKLFGRTAIIFRRMQASNYRGL